MIKDTKFLISLSILLLLNLIALYVLNFVSFNTKKNSHTDEFLTKLSNIETSSNFIEPPKKIKPSKVVIVEKKIIQKVKVPVNIYKSSSFVKKEKKAISKKNNTDNTTYTLLEKKFKKTSDYKIALKLSRLYYASKNYKKALKWSMIANELNQKDDGSWLLFAKSKIKLGEKEIAKKALMTYNKEYYSKKVEQLLDRIDL